MASITIRKKKTIIGGHNNVKGIYKSKSGRSYGQSTLPTLCEQLRIVNSLYGIRKEMKCMEERPDQSEEANEIGISLHDLSTSARALLKAINSFYEAKSACYNYLKIYYPGGIHEPPELSDDIPPF